MTLVRSLSLLPNVKQVSGAHTATFSKGMRLFLRNMKPVGETDNSLLFCAEVKNDWSNTSTLLSLHGVQTGHCSVVFSITPSSPFNFKFHYAFSYPRRSPRLELCTWKFCGSSYVHSIDYEKYCLLNAQFCILIETMQHFWRPRSHPLQVRRIFQYSTPRRLKQQGLVTTSINFVRTAWCYVDGG